MKACGQQLKKDARQSTSDTKKFKELEIKKEKKEQLLQVWSKREKLDFYRVVLYYGIIKNEDGTPNWEFLKVQAKLRKTHKLIERYYLDLLSFCRKSRVSRLKSRAPDSIMNAIDDYLPEGSFKTKYLVDKKLSCAQAEKNK